MLLLALFTGCTVTNTAAEMCEAGTAVDSSDGSKISTTWENLATGESAFFYYQEDERTVHVSCWVMTDDGLNDKVTVELSRHDMGISSKSMSGIYTYNSEEGIKSMREHLIEELGEEDGTQAEQDMLERFAREGSIQNAWGGTGLTIQQINGEPVGDSAATAQPSGGCKIDDQHGFFEDTAKVELTSSTGLTKFTSYMFRNEAARERSKKDVQYTMSLGQDACAVEVLVALKPKEGAGGIDIGFEVKQSAAFNEAMMVSKYLQVEYFADRVEFSYPTRVVQLAGGIPPSGSSNSTSIVLAVATELVCEETGQRVNATITRNGPTGGGFRLTVGASDAPESCGWMFWDPLLQSTKGKAEKGVQINAKDSGAGAGNMHMLVVAFVLTVAMLQ